MIDIFRLQFVQKVKKTNCGVGLF